MLQKSLEADKLTICRLCFGVLIPLIFVGAPVLVMVAMHCQCFAERQAEWPPATQVIGILCFVLPSLVCTSYGVRRSLTPNGTIEPPTAGRQVVVWDAAGANHETCEIR